MSNHLALWDRFHVRMLHGKLREWNENMMDSFRWCSKQSGRAEGKRKNHSGGSVSNQTGGLQGPDMSGFRFSYNRNRLQASTNGDQVNVIKHPVGISV